MDQLKDKTNDQRVGTVDQLVLSRHQLTFPWSTDLLAADTVSNTNALVAEDALGVLAVMDDNLERVCLFRFKNEPF